VAYIVIRAVQLPLYFYAAADDRQLRMRLLVSVLGGTAQTLLWAASFLIDAGGQRAVYAFRGAWPLRSPTHFSERHDLVLIIALGESLISLGTGAGRAMTLWPVLVAALLGLAVTVCLWWLYFDNAAAVASQALAQATGIRRDKIASDAYSLGLLPLIAGVIYLALGIEQVLADLARKPQQRGGEPLNWASTTALYGGVVLYLTGRLLFLWLAVRSAPPAKLVAAGVALLLLPAARALPALAALGLLTAFLVALVCYERLTQRSKAVAPSG
jgi:low temperature requirement protein LtrA